MYVVRAWKFDRSKKSGRGKLPGDMVVDGTIADAVKQVQGLLGKIGPDQVKEISTIEIRAQVAGTSVNPLEALAKDD